MRRIDTRSREWKGKDHFNISLIERTSQIICGAVLWVIGRQFYLLLSRYMVSSRSARTYDQTRPRLRRRNNQLLIRKSRNRGYARPNSLWAEKEEDVLVSRLKGIIGAWPLNTRLIIQSNSYRGLVFDGCCKQHGSIFNGNSLFDNPFALMF